MRLNPLGLCFMIFDLRLYARITNLAGSKIAFPHARKS